MSASRYNQETRARVQPSSIPSFDFAIVPNAPRSALRCAPFVVLGALVMYAVIVVTALTGPKNAGETEEPTTKSGRSVAFVVPSTPVVAG